MQVKSKLGKYITIGSVVALVLGIAGGILAKNFEFGVIIKFSPLFEIIGKLWVIILLLLIIPIAGSYIISVFISISSTREIGKLGGISVLVHTLNFMVGVAIALGLGYFFIHLFRNEIPVFMNTDYASNVLNELGQSNSVSLGNFIKVLNGFQKVLSKVIMVFIFGSIAFTLVISGTKWEIKNRLQKHAARFSEKSFVWLEKFLFTLPIAVFCLLFALSVKEGLFMAGAVAYLILILIILLVVMLLFQYLLVACCGAVSVKHFLKSLFPAQLIAMSTRSSLATMPALLECAEKRIGLPQKISGIIIPFFVTAFRINYSISTTFALIFLAHIFQINLEIQTILIFILAQMLLSFGSPGIPSGGHYINLSLYLAAGIPIEGVLLMKAVDHIPDIFKTLLNVTEVIAVTTVVAKTGKIKLEKL